jgi:hypothetical protein
LNLKLGGVLHVGTPRLRRVVNSSPTTTVLIGNGYAMTVESIKAQIDELASELYDNGWKDCRDHYASLPLNSAKTERLEKENIIQKRRLSLAVKLLRMAQASECGQLGQYDRFFQEGYEVGFEEVV